MIEKNEKSGELMEVKEQAKTVRKHPERMIVAYLAGAGAYLSAGGSDRPVYVPAERTAVSALQPVGLSGLWAGRSRNFGGWNRFICVK